MNTVSGRPSRRSQHANPVKIWRDIFAVFDDGTYTVRDYAALEHMLLEQQRKFVHGLGCLVVIPPGAQRISDDVRNEIDRVLNSISVRGLCWAVMDKGFKGASIRAVLTTLNLFGKRKKYPTFVTGGLEEALTWLLPHLEGGNARVKEISDGMEIFSRQLDAPGQENAIIA